MVSESATCRPTRQSVRQPPDDVDKPPSKSAKPTEVPTKDDLQTFYEALENPKYKTAFLFAATSGLRSSELCQLTMDDIDDDKRMIVPDKDSKTRQTWVTFYNEEAADAFEAFKPERKPTSECSRPRSNR